MRLRVWGLNDKVPSPMYNKFFRPRMEMSDRVITILELCNRVMYRSSILEPCSRIVASSLLRVLNTMTSNYLVKSACS